ncbi:chymotrypsin-like protease CTRL-1 [Trichonephila inaurata madagascariensis]|uniref:Chymotrypsin-like protease CTRL-1 n=1 Tax=Trichonephila inaurata madagascariensis TaxID=2747483 RepID=A0A8X6YL11_9ARAC|nr:chymotrypsin-like protease CTRL-1 [Trichonephila inaurata madagascariensis]
MASLIARSSDKIFCGGALITDQYVLTAAHCTIRIPRNHILVRLAHPDSSTSSSQDLEVIEIKRHAGYNPRTMQNDIALLKLSKRVRLGDFRRLICLTDDDEDFVDKSASLLRWKGTLGEIGDVESLPVISNEECQNRMRSVIPDSILCAEPRTVTMCNADSGAPFIISEKEKFKVIGLLTWNRNDCDERFPTIFTRVSSYSRWIQRHTS